MATSTTSDKVARYIETLNHTAQSEEACDEVMWADDAEQLQADQESEAPPTAAESSTFGLIELLLKNQRRLDWLARSPQMQRELIPRLLAIGLIGYTIFGVALAIVFNTGHVWPELTSPAVWLDSDGGWLDNGGGTLIHFAPDAGGAYWSRWLDGSALKLIAAFTLGLIGAIGVCLPSFYFYGLLAGVSTTMLQVTANALKGMASSAVALVGVLPIYFAAVLGLLVINAAGWLVAAVCFLGLTLPFIAGLYGTRSLYVGFVGLADTMAADRRCRRECFLRRLLFAWSACFTAVTPVMIFTLWEHLTR
jgi:hypothetical protein